MHGRQDGGAAAVEFALIAIVLVTMLVGILEFGRLWAVQGSLAQAARDSARTYAITNDPDAVEEAFLAAFSWNTLAGSLAITPSDAAAGVPGEEGCRRTVRATYELRTLTGFLGDTWTLTAEGSMRCNG